MVRPSHDRRVTAQATVELVIGLVALVVLFVALAQIGRLGHESIRNLMQAREAAERAMLASGTTVGESIRTWTDGPDALAYTADDAATAGFGDLDVFTDELTQPVALATLETNPTYGLGGAFSAPLSAGTAVAAADLRQGNAGTTIDVENALRTLLFMRGDARLSLHDSAVMPGIRLDD